MQRIPKFLKKLFSAAVLFGLFFAVSPAASAIEVDRKTAATYMEAARLTARQLPRMHLTHIPFNNYIATNALELFLTTLDPDHSLFLAADVADFRKVGVVLDDWMMRGDVGLACKVYDVFLQRMSNRVAYVDLLLTNGFDLGTKEVFKWKRKDAPWPKDEKEWNNLWRKKIENQYIARMVAKALDSEEKARQLAKEKEAASNNLVAASVSTNALGIFSNELAKLALVATTNSQTNALSKELAGLLNMSPEEFISKDYHQYLDVLRDNDADWLLTLYINSFARVYDPHSDYMSANNTEDFDINMKLSLVGIGAMLGVDDGAAKVERLIPGGPADRDGRLRPGDKIVAVAQDDEEPVNIVHWPLSKSVRLIRGKKGTTVVLTVIPAADISGATVRKIDLVRDEVKLEERAAKGVVKELKDAKGKLHRLGVITVPDFYADMHASGRDSETSRSVTRDVRKIINGFVTSHVEGVVLDLRSNGGGSLPEAIDMASLFVKSGPIVQVKSQGGVQVLTGDDPEVTYGGPLVVLVNRLSASASEIVAGALQDYGRAVVIGDTKTHGKGTVQSLVALSRFRQELGSLKVTTASFYRINGSSTQLEGVRPDIVVPSMLDYVEIGEEYLPNALPWSLVDSAYYKPDTNLTAMLPELKKHSQERLEADKCYRHYRELLQRFGEKRKSDTVSLNLEERLKSARAEKELSDLVKDDILDFDNLQVEDNKKDEVDIVMDEGLQVLLELSSKHMAKE